ncbi:MAG TPA: sugar phosphate isomerase/epimerase family protein [Pirellulales bacterium]|jgi:sugar phosphate isomerase/epimerase|nr:sugar phosphate isomerase/epimerase family protein [Pirellulales bacterium]
MITNISRRDFFKSTSAFSLVALATTGLNGITALAEESAKANAEQLKVALNAYSFSKLLNDSIKNRGGGVTLLEVLDFAAKQKCEGFDPTGYFFPGYPKVPSDEYLNEFKRRAAELGMGISGTGVRNNFTTSDKSIRAESVKHIKEWVEVAARLGAPVIRVFADTQMRASSWEQVAPGASRNDVQAWIAADLQECAEQGKKFGVRIGVQNHGDFLQTGEQLLALIKAVGSQWCGPIVDTGYFKTDDPYQDIALVAPHALNWQIKQSPFGQDSDVPIDLVKLVQIARKSGYHGYLPVETLSPKGKDYDPYTVVPSFLSQLREAIKQTA